MYETVHTYFPELPAQKAEFVPFLTFNKVLPLYYEEAASKGRHLEEVKDPYRQSVLRSMQIEAAVRVLLPMLEKAGIRVILLKGIALGAYVYPSLRQRPMVDIDLLIHPKAEEAARQLLMEAGATESYPLESVHTMGHWHHAPPLHFRSVSVELHHQLFHSYEKLKIPVEDLFAHAQSIPAYHTTCQVLCPEHQLMHLVYHLYHHAVGGDIRLIWLQDIHLLLEKTSCTFNWDRFGDWVQAQSVDEPFRKVLDACYRLLGTHVPNKYLLEHENPMALDFTTKDDKTSVSTETKRREIPNTKRPTDSDQNLKWLLSLCRIPARRPVKIGTLQSLPLLKSRRLKVRFIFAKMFPRPTYLRHKFPNRSLLVAYGLLYLFFLKKLFIVALQKKERRTNAWNFLY